VFSAEGNVIPDIYNPGSITVDENHIYITQRVEVFIYSKKDLKLLYKFGKIGEGPQEFKQSPLPWIPSINIYLKDNQLMINSTGKVSYFSQKGEFIKESTTGRDARYIPVGEKYIRMQYLTENRVDFISADLVDANFKKLKRVCSYKFPAQQGKKRDPLLLARMSSYFIRYVYDDKFVFPSDTNTIHIFDAEGNEITSFTPDYTKVPIDNAMKKRFDQYFSNHLYKEIYLNEKRQNLIRLPDYMPIFKDYRLADNKIYILSSFKKQGKYETFIYDFSGKLLKKTFLPLLESDEITSLYPFDIKDNKIYQLVLDEDEDQYMLCITDI
jgi:hypothetical protein